MDSLGIELQLQILSILMGLVGVVVPAIILVAGVVYVRRFEDRLSNMNSDIDAMWDTLEAEPNHEHNPQAVASLHQQELRRRETKRLRVSVRWLTAVVIALGLIFIADVIFRF